MHAPARLVVAAAPARVGAGPGYGGPAVCLFSLAAHTSRCDTKPYTFRMLLRVV
jgi:hypothetical protein